jgi:hypothetical protein
MGPAPALRNQRFDTYIVISMPKRKSTASGVSHFMRGSSFALAFPTGDLPDRWRHKPRRRDG